MKTPSKPKAFGSKLIRDMVLRGAKDGGKMRDRRDRRPKDARREYWKREEQ